MSLYATTNALPNEPLDQLTVQRLEALPTAIIGDAMGRMGVVDSDIKPMWNGATFVGTAFTVWTRAGDNKAIHEALQGIAAGNVMLVNGQGDTTRALLGELIAGRGRLRGVKAFVIDGAVRDADGCRGYRMPVFARAMTAAGPYKVGPGTIGATIAIGGVAVHPGDVVCGDADGVVVIPRANLDAVLIAAEKKRDAEADVRAELERAFSGQSQPIRAGASSSDTFQPNRGCDS